MASRSRAIVFLTVLLAAVAFDQGSKAWARTLPVPAHCATKDLIARDCAGIPQPVIAGYWDWELAMNSGAAFSSFTSFAGSTGTRVILSLVAALALIGIGIAAARTRPEERMKRVALALIAGGALGNLIDRIHQGAVTDFVRWRIHDHVWPIFNVADAALLVGVALLIIERARSHRANRGHTPAAA